jgi:hypothetical protein
MYAGVASTTPAGREGRAAGLGARRAEASLTPRGASNVYRTVCRSAMNLDVFAGPRRPGVSTTTAGRQGPAVFGDRCSTN